MQSGLMALTAAAVGALGCEVASAAPHSLVKRGLQEASCIPASLVEAVRAPGRVAYDVTCRGAVRRTLVLVCTPTRCFPDEHGEVLDED